jgi:hypothetical protein
LVQWQVPQSASLWELACWVAVPVFFLEEWSSPMRLIFVVFLQRVLSVDRLELPLVPAVRVNFLLEFVRVYRCPVVVEVVVVVQA